MKFLCDKCKAKYQISDEKVAGRTVRMKCRKCGHLIEVRSEVTETSTTTALAHVAKLPQAAAERGPTKPAGPPLAPPPPHAVPPAPATPPPRPSPSQRGAHPPVPDVAEGSLAGAFRTSVERKEGGTPPPINMTELHAADEWYVAINGVPVGPILVAEVRRKAALGSVTEDSLVWQEGLDEWRPVKTFPELAVTVREAARAGRSSLIPPVPPPRAKVPSSAERNSPSRARDHDVPLPQGNAPISSVQANADSPPVHAVTDLGLRRAEPIIAPTPASNSADPRPISVVSDPFKVLEQPTGRPIVSPSKAVAVPTSAPADAASRTSNVPVARLSHGTPWLAIAMVAAATAFGITTAIVVFLPRPAQPSADVTNHTSVAATSVAALPPSAAAPSEGTPDDAPSASTLSDSRRRPPAIQQPPRSTPVAAVTATATAQPRPIDTHLAQTQSLGAIPTDNASESMAPPSQCQSEGQVQQVIGLHQPAMRRTCWERSAGDKLAASVSVALTIGPDGSSQGVSVTGDDPSLAKCIENDVRSWHFAPMGCAQKTAFSLKFVRQ